MTNENATAATETRLSVPWLWPLLILLAVSALFLGIHLISELTERDGGNALSAGFGLDREILLRLRVPGRPDLPVGPLWLQQSAIDVSALGGFTLLWLFGVSGLAALLFLRKRREAVVIAASLVGSTLLNGLLKHWIARPRPALVPHFASVDTASFPSGHAMISAATYLTLALMLCESWPTRGARVTIVSFFACVVVLIGCSRVYLGVHWPSDVLAGWCFGTVWALAMFAGNRWLKVRG